MSEAFRAPEPDTARVPRRDGQSSGPQMPTQPALAPHVQAAVDRNPALYKAIEAQNAKPPPEPEPPPDPEKQLAEPFDALPQWEAEHVFKLAAPVTRSGVVLHELRLRAPNALDIFEVGGLPNKTNWTQTGMTMEMDVDKFKKWLARLSLDADLPLLYRIPARDMRAMYEWLVQELNQAGN